jgi:hypothetical protein
LLADPFSSGTEFKLILRFERRLLVDRRDGSFDFTDDRRSGTITTGIPPCFNTSRRALPLAIELTVLVDA